jgi:DNA-binding response OmpR family regulator
VARLLIAEPSPPMQRWLAAALSLAPPVRPVCELVSDGIDLLYHLAEDGDFDLVVAPAVLPGLAGTQVLAMARTAGLTTPFLITTALGSGRLRRVIGRAGPAELVDPLDAAAVAAAARRLLESSPERGAQVSWPRALATMGLGIRDTLARGLVE